MHDIDRTQLEAWETGYETDAYEMDSYEYEGEATFEGPFSEVEEMELASELLEVTDEAELDQFLGKVVGSFLKGPVGRHIIGKLKGVAKNVLPMVGSAAGSIIPGLGTVAGGAIGTAAANAFELELEGLSAEDQEFELARRYVRLAGEVAQQATQAPQGTPPQEQTRAAMVAAAQKHAPGLLQPKTPAAPATHHRKARSGRWIREGNTIILLGA